MTWATKRKEEFKKESGEIKGDWKEIWKQDKDVSPPKQIHDLREHFANLLAEMEVSLVVFVDDLGPVSPGHCDFYT